MRSFSFAALLAMFAFGVAGWVAGACSSSGSTSPQTTPRDGGASGDAADDCSYPAVHNEAGCPATYSTATLPPTCAPVGLTCQYPGQGDGITPGCAATAVLWCESGPGDAGPHWVAAQ